MDTRFLESFVFVVDRGSIAEASRRLNLTPAAVAQRIRALESDVGAPLLLRSGRTVRPTEAGARILDSARSLLLAARDLGALATNDEIAGEIQLGAVPTALTGLVPDLLARLSRTHPLIRVHVVPGMSLDLYKLANSGDIDAALLVQPEFALSKSCDWQMLRKEALILLAPAAMAGRDPHSILRREPFIRLGRETRGGRLADDWLRQEHIQPVERLELTSLPAIAILVDRGVGVSLVPDWAPPWPEGLRLRKIAVPRRTQTRNIGLVWNRSTPRAGPVRTLLRVATEVAAGRRA